MNRKEEPKRVTALLDKWKKQLEEKLKNPELLKAGKEELLKGLLSFGIGFFLQHAHDVKNAQLSVCHTGHDASFFRSI